LLNPSLLLCSAQVFVQPKSNEQIPSQEISVENQYALCGTSALCGKICREQGIIGDSFANYFVA
jgi:hypothetical protein